MAVLLGWDVERGAPWLPPFADAQAEWAEHGTVTSRFCLRGDAPAVGTTVHLMLQGRTRGLIGRGTVRSAPFSAGDPASPGSLAAYVLIEWDHLLTVDDRIRPEELAARAPEVDWAGLYRPELPLTDDQSARLDRVWASPHPSARPGPSRWARAAGLVPTPPRLVGLADRVLHH
jgi:hypothetical protein